MALNGDAQPSYTRIAKFVRELGEQVKRLERERRLPSAVPFQPDYRRAEASDALSHNGW